MKLLTIDLRDGFKDDTVSIKVEGNEVFRATDISTRVQIGLARSIELEIEGQSATVEINLPLKNLAERIELEMLAPVFIAVSLRWEGGIDWRISAEPFGYV